MKQALVGTAGLTALGSGLLYFRSSPKNPSLLGAAPIEPLGSTLNSSEFSGDAPARAHRALWDKTAYLKSKGPVSEPAERVPVVVIGGGMSGLASAYFLKDLSPVVLEQANRFGGNSKGENWGGVDYSIGAAYMAIPESGTIPTALLDDLHLLQKCRREESGEVGVYYESEEVQKLQVPFWEGVTDRGRASEFRHVRRTLRDVFLNSYPEIPTTNQGKLKPPEFRALDRMSFSKWVSSTFENVHPHIDEYLSEYTWSSFGGGPEEVSAAQVLNFLAGDMMGVVALPGGNASISQALYQNLQKFLPSSSLRANSLVVDISVLADGVRVLYENEKGQLQAIVAKRCIVSSAKFIVRHLISEIPHDQLAAMNRLQYRAYLVANILIRKKFKSPAYDFYRITGRPIRNTEEEGHSRAYTDVIFANWASHDGAPDRSVVTLYKALPFGSARAELYTSDSFSRSKVQFEKSLPQLLQALGSSMGDVDAVRITRWGHAIPLASPALIADGTCAAASRPIADRIFFAQQDNWANPCMETCVLSAHEASGLLRKSLI